MSLSYASHSSVSVCNSFEDFNSWSHLVTMIFSLFTGRLSLRQVSEGLQSATGNLNRPGLSCPSSKSNISCQNANRTSQFFQEVFYALFQYLEQYGDLKQMKKTLKDEDLSSRLNPNVPLSKYVWTGAIYTHIKKGCQDAYSA